MLVGHAGLAAMAKTAEPRLNLGVLLFAAMAVDLPGCVLALAGLNTAMAVARSLSGALARAVIFAIAAMKAGPAAATALQQPDPTRDNAIAAVGLAVIVAVCVAIGWTAAMWA